MESKTEESISILIKGEASRKEIAQSLRRIAKVVGSRKVPGHELNLGWDCEPFSVKIEVKKSH